MAHRARILVVDDDPLFRSLIVSILRKDYLVSVAADGEEGYFKALEHMPDAAIVDVQMPRWDGLKTLKCIRAQPVLRSLPVMMLTGDASKDTVLAAVQSGANNYMIKSSFSKEEFLTKLERLINPAAAPAPTVNKTSPPEAVSAPHTPVAVAATPAAAAPATAEQSRLTEIMEDWE